MAILKKKTSSRRSSSKGKDYITDEMIRSPWFWIILAAGLAIYFIFLRDSNDSEDKTKIDSTTDCITSIKEIEEWEFLTLHLEELIDTVVPKKLSECQSAKIFSGTAHLGINTKKANKSWIVLTDNKANITLPPIELLDKEIIDDTRTRTFYEKGTISATVKEKMYQNAKRRLKAKAMQKENIKMAEENAKDTFKSLFTALGYKTVKVTFKK
ncbi:MAG: DUF4230 domain-containing protein [Paludibacteraceae bacterium]|nr:DUF4230 domain-containing protein [Paludibacteraceae bacterium]